MKTPSNDKKANDDSSNDEVPQTEKRDLRRHYKNLLKSREPVDAGFEGVGFEAASGVDLEPDLSNSAIKDRVDSSSDDLHRIIKEHLGDKPELYEIADQISSKGREALRALRDDDDTELADRGDVLDGLEAIVRTDGSRPSFMIREGAVDLTTSPIGSWGDYIMVSADMLQDSLDCVGRIDLPSSAQGFEGTGFLIHENLILTNRHVLQVIADWQPEGYTLKPGAAIDFGHEFQARLSVNRRPLKRVVFCGSQVIKGSIDHKKLDIALIELEPAAESPKMVLSVNASQDWAQPEKNTTIYTVGYPGDPGVGVVHPTLLEQLFKSTFGCKRLAPGVLMKSQVNAHTWTLAHDATTLGGNSGSVVLVVGKEHTAAAIHYGGRRGDPRENWGHVLGRTLDDAGVCGDKEKTLRQHFVEFGVTVVN